MTTSLPDEHMAIADVLRRWPETVFVIVRRRMACLGCALAPFMTLSEVARSYRVDVKELQAELTRPIQAARGTGEAR